MPHEPRANWGRVAPDQAPKPDPRFALVPPMWFVDRHVKLGFPCLQTPTRLEHCWVYVYGYKPDLTLLGILDNDPVHNIGIQCGDCVQFTRAEIEAVDEG